MQRCLGHAEIVGELGDVVVHETLTCSHCNRVFVKPRINEPAGFCHMCMKPTCLRCGADDRCVPFEKKLEEMEARSRLLRMVG